MGFGGRRGRVMTGCAGKVRGASYSSNAIKQLEHEGIRTGPRACPMTRDYDLLFHNVQC